LRESDKQNPGRRVAVRFVTIGSQAKAEQFCAQQNAASLCIGDEDRRTYRAMGLEDFNLLKRFRFAESKDLLFQASFINAFNRHVFNRPDLNPTDGNFGQINPDNLLLTPRKIQLMLKFEY